MFMATCSADSQQWSAGELLPYGPLPMYPSAQALNYGQAVFEGMKAQRSAKVRARPPCPHPRLHALAASPPLRLLVCTRLLQHAAPAQNQPCSLNRPCAQAVAALLLLSVR